jgi:pimeloyl-ACP methyl ester carboxylesterase
VLPRFNRAELDESTLESLTPMPKARKLVITIHGVSPDRKWQTRAARVLEPHFRCIPIVYHHYASPIGALVVFFNVSTFIALTFAFHYLPMLRRPAYAVVSAVAACIMSVIGARIRRRWVVDRVKAQISTKTGRKPTHVVAHSFGTYICGWALERSQDLRFERIVLVGSVLPTTFNWRALHRRQPLRFTEVRNEIGMSDCVVWLVTWMQKIARDLGVAGLRGFVGKKRDVHNSRRPWGPCHPCLLTQQRPLIHNVFLAKYRHSTWALGPGHASELWLPYLWDLSPHEFNAFVECCRDAAYAYQEKRWQELDKAEHLLRDRTWTWTRGHTLETFLGDEVDSLTSRPQTRHAGAIRKQRAAIIEDAFIGVYLAIADAYEESTNLDPVASPEHDQVAIAFYPPFAISRALDTAVRERLPA